MKIVGIGGSLRSDSYAYLALELALKKIANKGVATQLIDLRKLNLPFCTGDVNYPTSPDVDWLRQEVKSSTGILLATPEYHGSVTGVLKNALDLLEEEHMAGKVVGLMAIVGGVHSTNAINTLRIICRQLNCWVLPQQLVIPHSAESFDQQGQLIDPLLEDRMNKLVNHFLEAATKLSSR